MTYDINWSIADNTTGCDYCEIDIPNTAKAAILARKEAWSDRHQFWVDLITFDEDGEYTERTVAQGHEPTAHEARIAAEVAFLRLMAGRIERVA